MNNFNLPNLISFSALFLSWIGIVILLNRQFYISFAVILLAFILDALDGFFARKFNQESNFGRQLDSHVDVFIYLLYPALSFYLFFGLVDVISLMVIFIYLSTGIFRLVRFNTIGYVTCSNKKDDAYLGLPVFFNHFPLLMFLALYKIKYFYLIAQITILLNSFLMVSKIHFPKPKNIWPFVTLLLLTAGLMIYLGLYGTH